MTIILPAERARGLVDVFDLTSPQEILSRGGVITGNLAPYDSQKGAAFDGVNDYCVFPARSQPVLSGFASLVVEFTPTFAAGSGVAVYVLLSCASTGGNFSILKYGSGGSYAMSLQCGTINQSVSLVNYEPYWIINGRNVLVWTFRSGSNLVYFNGNLVDTETDAYTPLTIDAPIYVGSSTTGTLKFAGNIHSIKFFRHNSAAEQLTAGEAVDYINRSTWTYENKALCRLSMGAAQHDATNLKTLDASPTGRHFTWTAGATAPTKLSTVGYSADGGDTFSNASVIANSTYTVALVMRHSSATGYMADWRGGGGTGYIRLGSAVLLEASSGTAYVNGKPSTVLAPGNFNVIMVTGIALNGPAGTKLLADNAGATGITGSIHGYAVWPGTLTPLQVKDHWVRSMAMLNQV
jgi:hypothetical protein